MVALLVSSLLESKFVAVASVHLCCVTPLVLRSADVNLALFGQVLIS